MPAELTVLTVPGTPLMLRAAALGPKLVPLMVTATFVPDVPEPGEIPVIVGAFTVMWVFSCTVRSGQ